MILLTRFNGPMFALNPDLVERADHTPDTVITLVDGTKYVIAESLDELIRIIRRHRAAVLADAELLINGHFREAGWPPAGQSFKDQASAPVPVHETVLEAVLDPERHDHEQGTGPQPRQAEPVQQIRPGHAAGPHPSSHGPGPDSSPSVIPFHRREQ